MRRGGRHVEGCGSVDKCIELGMTTHCLPLHRSCHLGLVKSVLLDKMKKKTVITRGNLKHHKCNSFLFIYFPMYLFKR